MPDEFSQIEKSKNSSKDVKTSDKELVTKDQDLLFEDKFADLLLESNRSFFQMIFPDKVIKASLDFQAKLANKRAASRLEQFGMYKEFQTQSLREALDGLLIRGKAQVRSDNIKFYVEELTQLSNTVNELEARYYNEAANILQEIEKIPNDKIKNIRLVSFTKRLEEFSSAVNTLMSSFKSIVDEGVVKKKL